MIAYLHMTPVAAHIVNFATKLSIKKLTNRYARNLRVLIRLARLSCKRRRGGRESGSGKVRAKGGATNQLNLALLLFRKKPKKKRENQLKTELGRKCT